LYKYVDFSEQIFASFYWIKFGKAVIKNWNEKAVVPSGWNVETSTLIQNWKIFAQQIENKYLGKTILVVTSNGIARFSPYITESFDKFSRSHNLKIATGAICVFEKKANDKNWINTEWNLKPC
jgi:probable phosphoglycerate mutase